MSFGHSTLRGSPVVEAPGKIFLIGEYAVLHQGTAVLAAVDRFAVAQYLPEYSPESAVVAESVRRAGIALGELAQALPPGSVLVNTSEFRHGASKLGLGSSAATAAASVAAVFEMAGLAIATQRDLLFSIADAAHRAAQGGVGSGADVAVAVHGGFIKFVRPAEGDAAVAKLTAPARLRIVVFWTGQPVSTPAMIEGVDALARRSPALHGWIIDELRTAADGFVQAFAAQDTRGVIDMAGDYGRLLGELGSAAKVEIGTPLFGQVADLAESLAGSAKPSGAGGGDIGVAFFDDAEAAAEFGRRCPAIVSVLDVTVGVDGAKRRIPGTVQMLNKGPTHA